MPRNGGRQDAQSSGKKRKKRTDPNKTRVIRIDPYKFPTPDPYWTSQELAQVTEEICRFIGDAKRRHVKTYKVDVGEWFFLNAYRGDIDLLTDSKPTKEGSLHDLALGVGISYDTLRHWIIAAAARHLIREMGLDASRIGLSQFAALYSLKDRPRLLEQLAGMVHEKRITVEELQIRIDVALNRKTERRKKKKKKKSRRRPPRPADELAVVRVLQVMDGWIGKIRLGKVQRERLAAMLRELRDLILAQDGVS
jgi:hypothetical protein